MHPPHHNNKLIITIYCILSWVVISINSYTPIGRFGQSSALVGDRIYYFGGEHQPKMNISTALDEVLYLDLSDSFDIKTPSWINITPKSKIPFANSYSTAVSHLNDDDVYMVYLIGGVMVDATTDKDKFTSVIHTFNTVTNEWSTLNTSGKIPDRRYELTSVIDDSNKIRIFGGVTNTFTGSPVRKWFTDQYVLDLKTMIWSLGLGTDTPTLRYDFSTTLLPNGLIICVGGWEIPSSGKKEQFIEFNQV